MIFSHFLNHFALMFALLAGHEILLCNHKENLPMNEYLGFPENVEKKQVGKWKESKIKLLRSKKQSSVAINAKQTVYKISHGSRKQTIPAIAFSDPKSGIIWGGPEQDGYLELENKILGFRIIGQKIIWCESLLKHGSNKAAPTVTNRFEQDITGYSLLRAAIRSPELFAEDKPTRLGSHIKNPWMFTNGPFDSQGADPILANLQWDKGLLKLDLTDQTKQFEATVWIDLKSREVKKVEEKPWTLLDENLFKNTNDQ